MRYSKLFGKTLKSAPKDAVLASHRLLHQAGYIRESTAGRYYLLPLGWRVHDKIKKIIKEEMDAAGAQEMLTPVLHPKSLWQETNRTNSVGFELMCIKDRNEMEFVLGGTAEEMFTDLVRKFQISYKDLPFNLYQFSTKFRDEMRARGGLLRLREFIMKDAYSFDKDEGSFKAEYKKMSDTYSKIFERMGIQTIIVESDNGYIGGEYCHEFVVEAEAGESKFYVTKDGSYAAHEDVAKFKREQVNPDEEQKPLEIVDQPEWVHTMEDNIKHYKLPKSHFLKNVVYKNKVSGEIIVAVIRGDLEVNTLKLGHVLKMEGLLDPATDRDLAVLGTKPGYVHSWGHAARYIGDLSLTSVKNFIGGQKEEKTDSINVNYGRDFICELLADIALVQEGFTAENGMKLVMKRGIEVGNIFQLGYHYSSRMEGTSYLDKKGEKKPFYMGCYGIGLARTFATIVEKYHDGKGIIWPESVAPFRVHLIGIVNNDDGVRKKADEVYEKLKAAGIDVLYDDRENSGAGEKFADADLIGIPVRLVVSAKTLQQSSDQVGIKVEWKKRESAETELLDLASVLKRL